MFQQGGMFQQGLIAAPHTPMTREGQVDLVAIERQAAFLETQPIGGVFVGGSTGECTSLTTAERQAITARWVELWRDSSRRILVHVGSNALPDAIELARHAATTGADGIAAFAPHYFRPADEANLVEFLAPIAAAAPELPFYYYDIPRMTHVKLESVDFLTRAVERIKNFRGIKFTNPDLKALGDSMESWGDRLEFLFGCDEMLLAGLHLGVHGAIGSTYNFAAPLYHRIVECFAQRDLAEAEKLQRLAQRLIETLAQSGFMSSSKAVMEWMGVDCGPPRLPLRELATGEKRLLFDRLAELECLEPWPQECRSDGRVSPPSEEGVRHRP